MKRYLWTVAAVLALVGVLFGCTTGGGSWGVNEERVRRDVKRKLQSKLKGKIKQDTLRIKLDRKRKKVYATVKFKLEKDSGKVYNMKYKLEYKRKRGAWKLRKIKRKDQKRVGDKKKDKKDIEDEPGISGKQDDSSAVAGMDKARLLADMRASLGQDFATAEIVKRPRVKSYTRNGKLKLEAKVYVKRAGTTTRYKLIYKDKGGKWKLNNIYSKSGDKWEKVSK